MSGQDGEALKMHYQNKPCYSISWVDHGMPQLESVMEQQAQATTVTLMKPTTPSSATPALKSMIQGRKQGGRLPKGEAGFPWGQENIKAMTRTSARDTQEYEELLNN